MCAPGRCTPPHTSTHPCTRHAQTIAAQLRAEITAELEAKVKHDYKSDSLKAVSEVAAAAHSINAEASEQEEAYAAAMQEIADASAREMASLKRQAEAAVQAAEAEAAAAVDGRDAAAAMAAERAREAEAALWEERLVAELKRAHAATERLAEQAGERIAELEAELGRLQADAKHATQLAHASEEAAAFEGVPRQLQQEQMASHLGMDADDHVDAYARRNQPHPDRPRAPSPPPKAGSKVQNAVTDDGWPAARSPIISEEMD